MVKNECPYGAGECPKISDLRDKVEYLEANQVKIIRTLYYIAGIVSVSLGVNVIL